MNKDISTAEKLFKLYNAFDNHIVRALFLKEMNSLLSRSGTRKLFIRQIYHWKLPQLNHTEVCIQLEKGVVRPAIVSNTHHFAFEIENDDIITIHIDKDAIKCFNEMLTYAAL